MDGSLSLVIRAWNTSKRRAVACGRLRRICSQRLARRKYYVVIKNGIFTYAILSVSAVYQLRFLILPPSSERPRQRQRVTPGSTAGGTDTRYLFGGTMKPAQLVVLLGGAGVPTAPTLSAPANAAVLDDTTPEFSWQAVPGATSYDIEIRATLTGTPTATGITGTTYTPGADLSNVVVYSWRVRAVNAAGAGAWSVTRTFTPIVAWLEDRFVTDDAAPIASPRTTEPGGQTLTIVDTNSKMSITGGKVVALSGGSSVYDPGFYGAVKTRVAGRALALTLNTGIANNTEYMGFAGSATLVNTLWRLAFTTNSGLFAVDGGTTVSNLGWIEPDTWYTLALIVRTTGMYFLVKDGAFAGWRLL